MTTTLDLSTLVLSRGKHRTPRDGLCLMEAVAFVSGEDHTDAPGCAAWPLARLGRALNDTLPSSTRQRLVPLIPRLVGTRGDCKDSAREWVALDWMLREHIPTWLDAAGLNESAALLRSRPRIDGPSTRRAAIQALTAAEKAVDAAAKACGWAAASDVMRKETADIVDTGIWRVMSYIAMAISRSALPELILKRLGWVVAHEYWRAKGLDPAYTGTGDASMLALNHPAVRVLWDSAIAAFERMIDPPEVTA